jgi:acetyl-CoA decarbonylase/synthase complex subunit gamma
MPLTGIQIYKLLPQTNCKECGYPTCLAFAMKLAAKQAELAACPYVSEESKSQLAESSAPPIRLVTLKGHSAEIRAGNETVLFRHEKTFFNRPGLFVRVRSSQSDDELRKLAAAVEAYSVTYCGMELKLDGFVIEADDESRFVGAIQAVRNGSGLPLCLSAAKQALLQDGLSALPGEKPLILSADESNWEALADLAKQSNAALAVSAASVEALAELAGKVKAKGVEDLVLSLNRKGLSTTLSGYTQIRRAALKNQRALGYPVIAFPCDAADEGVAAAQAIGKYAGFIVLDGFRPELVYTLLVLRENIYTDPQKPIQVQPGLYEIGTPDEDSPLMVTTNFSITYFAVANEIESGGQPAWLLVTDAEGMSVLTAWAAGKFDAARIAKAVKQFDVEQKVHRKRLVLPGYVAVLSGELENELPGWEIKVGPKEAVDIPSFVKQVL